MEETHALRNAEQEILYARDHARGRGEPTVIQLRKQLIEMQQGQASATSEKVRQQAEELRNARIVTQELTGQEASVCLDLRRANATN